MCRVSGESVDSNVVVVVSPDVSLGALGKIPKVLENCGSPVEMNVVLMIVEEVAISDALSCGDVKSEFIEVMDDCCSAIELAEDPRLSVLNDSKLAEESPSSLLG